MPPLITYTDERERLTVEALEALGRAELAVYALRDQLLDEHDDRAHLLRGVGGDCAAATAAVVAATIDPDADPC